MWCAPHLNICSSRDEWWVFQQLYTSNTTAVTVFDFLKTSKNVVLLINAPLVNFPCIEHCHCKAIWLRTQLSMNQRQGYQRSANCVLAICGHDRRRINNNNNVNLIMLVFWVERRYKRRAPSAFFYVELRVARRRQRRLASCMPPSPRRRPFTRVHTLQSNLKQSTTTMI